MELRLFDYRGRLSQSLLFLSPVGVFGWMMVFHIGTYCGFVCCGGGVLITPFRFRYGGLKFPYWARQSF